MITLAALPNLNGLRVTERRGNTIFVRLPRALWQLCGPDGSCRCPACSTSGRAAFWDTLAITAGAPEGNDTTWLVHHPDHRDYDLVSVRELGGSSYLTTTVEGPGRWSVLVPYVLGVPTEWHPTEATGPLSTLSRGAFKTEGEAIAWADRALLGHPYRLAFYAEQG